MTAAAGGVALYCVALVALAWPLGLYMARVYDGRPIRFAGWLAAGERGFVRLLGRGAGEEQDWKQYAKAVLALELVFSLGLYALLRMQNHLGLDPAGLGAVNPGIALNTTASFVTNTNWQFYSGEQTMSYLSQMAGLAVQNFVSAGVGMAVLVAVIRGFRNRSKAQLGNLWRDLYRSIVYILLPLSLLLALVLVSQGVVDTFGGPVHVAHTLAGTSQTIARGPAASQVAIKQLGTNGGGFYNSNSAVPFENPNGLTNFVEMLSLLLVPAASVFMFGRMIGARRQGVAIFAAMFALFLVGVAIVIPAELHGTQVLQQAHVASTANMEGKEQRFGIFDSSLWAVATTDASNGSVNAAMDSMTAAGGGVPLINMFLGEVIFGGAGSGLYGMLLYVLLAVFICGLMVGRTPEYLGKKIEAREVKLAVVGVLFVPAMVLVMTAVSVVVPAGLASIFNRGPHGFSEALYAYTSMGNNNGSAMAGYGATHLADYLGGVALYLGRFVPLIAALAVGGSLAVKQAVPASAGTFRTDSPTFVVVLVGVIVILAGLAIFPALALGPIADGLSHHLYG